MALILPLRCFLYQNAFTNRMGPIYQIEGHYTFHQMQEKSYRFAEELTLIKSGYDFKVGNNIFNVDLHIQKYP